MAKRFLLLIFFSSLLFSFENLYRVSIEPENFDDAIKYLQKFHLDIAGADHQVGKIEVIMEEEELYLLDPFKGRYVIKETSKDSFLRGPDLQNYTDPEEMEEFLFSISSQYPELADLVLLKEELFEGHKLWAIKITSYKKEGPKPVFLMDGQHHAREVMTAEITKDAIKYLLENYGKDEKVTKWLDEIEIWIIPIVNPDGASFCFRQNNWWRKNRNPQCAVDLNRNYPITWNSCNGSSGFCLDDDFRGTGPASEPETQGVVALMYAIKPQFYITYHSYGQYIIYPYGCDYTAEDNTFYEIASSLNNILEDDNGKVGRYRIGTSFDTLYVTDGTSDDEPYAGLGTFSFTIEVNSDKSGGFQPNYAQWRDITVQRQRIAWGFFLDQILYGPQIRGIVYDAFTKKPLEGVTFTVDSINWNLYEKPRITDEYGRFFFISQKNKTYILNFEKTGYFPSSITVNVSEGPVDLEIYLVREPLYLENFVKFTF